MHSFPIQKTKVENNVSRIQECIRDLRMSLNLLSHVRIGREFGEYDGGFLHKRNIVLYFSSDKVYLKI